ncbi:hypothetical protein HJB93_03470 [Rhizobium sp. NLR12b]|uniref:hypothetical protein n=1 Tax=unclassified Rhizobium TaxID=2613769 RepID=UPI001C83274F|nr:MULTISPECIES: hypothetical protein [unclassified Rhizobium]MBX5294524.1 hypothetical protein [Rhizobium sp. NLR15a]MBX5298313.1 hypothetical protein [Rhizobium sp. NLR12b]MBX5309867.1 hypothetical protein [Rhizobium sp. NLR11b]
MLVHHVPPALLQCKCCFANENGQLKLWENHRPLIDNRGCVTEMTEAQALEAAEEMGIPVA